MEMRPHKTRCPTALHRPRKGPQPPGTVGPVGWGMVLRPGAPQECLCKTPWGFKILFSFLERGNLLPGLKS